MMNLLVISLSLTTLLTAAVSSPSQSHHRDEVIVKEGHRIVTVEYDKEADGITKVLISPHDEKQKPEKRMFSGPRDLVCDTYGKCKHKVANALDKTKDMVKKTVGKDLGEGLSEKVTGHTVEESSAHGIGLVKELAGDVKAVVKDGASKDFDIVDSPKRIVEDVARNVTGGIQETVKNVQEMRGISLTDILSKYLPRQMFGMAQSRIYPVYFKAMAYCVSAALIGHLGSLKIEPKATKNEDREGRGVGVVIAAKEGMVDGGGPTVVVSAASVVVRPDVLRLNEKLKRLNAYSSTLNLFTLVALMWHMAYMGQRLQATRK
ncbi:hypothetical protein L1987_47140 [Smallanthus sonchifolius]|uniref:Uncharacterized protein n=1 Tax=Smallanthus sonchifolius TaxID=185202 RepID=A0ACB9G2P9_9ASTR|nr:hypothetical protein L1987_47140 [Smallanthus sonchifolius]